MSSLAHISDKSNCENLSGLVKRQRRICRRNVELMDSVRVGALMAIDECQAQFKYRRWNCSTENNLKLFGNVILKQGADFLGPSGRPVGYHWSKSPAGSGQYPETNMICP
ncbi:hypothetical protein RRG08_052378 [Elysia crispata]|uniref:Protein Wnt n=1 Tax=Elysia crispata TaxID=231223 RepID=A0AAE1DT94_9GAST|nr:hypothetical protein RRG08_052378 [Elysia crispata]